MPYMNNVRYIIHFLADLYLVLLVRDPRAIFSSRIHSMTPWCSKVDACSNMAYYCDNLKQDLRMFSLLKEKHGNRVLKVRFEDLALDPVNGMREILQSFGLELL